MNETANAIIVGSLSLGALYALVGIGLNVVYKTTQIVNFAQGAFLASGAFMYVSASRWTGHAAFPATVIAVLINAAVGALLYLVVVRRMLGAPAWTIVIMTFGLTTVIETVVSLIWGPGTVEYVTFGQHVYHVAGLHFTTMNVIALGSAIAIAGGVALAMRYTKWGVSTRAVADNGLLASQWGINVELLAAVAWAIAAGVGTLTGIVYASQTSVTVGLGGLGLAAFPAIMLGGIDSIPGAVVGGVIMGGVITGVTTWRDAQVASICSYVGLLAVLLLIPSGLFGTKEHHRV